MTLLPGIAHLGLPVLRLELKVGPGAPVQLYLDVVPRGSRQLPHRLVGLAQVPVLDGQGVLGVLPVYSN